MYVVVHYVRPTSNKDCVYLDWKSTNAIWKEWRHEWWQKGSDPAPRGKEGHHNGHCWSSVEGTRVHYSMLKQVFMDSQNKEIHDNLI